MIILRLAYSVFQRNRLLLGYVILQLSVIWIMMLLMVSSAVSRLAIYQPFSNFIENDGYFSSLSNDTSILNKYLDEPSDLSNAMNGVSDENVACSYAVNIIDAEDTTEMLHAFAYDTALYINHVPKIKSGRWLSEIDIYDGQEIPVVIYDATETYKIGDLITARNFGIAMNEDGEEYNVYTKVSLRVVGVLDNAAKVVYYNKLEYADCRAIFSSIQEVAASFDNQILYFMRAEDARKAKMFLISNGVAFVGVQEELSEEEIQANLKVILACSEKCVKLDDFQKNSLAYITDQMVKLLPIFICALLLTLLITISINAIVTYREINNYAYYYICGMRWKHAIWISLCCALYQCVISLLLSIPLGFLIYKFGGISDMSGIVSGWSVLIIAIFTILYLIIAMVCPWTILHNRSPKQILTR